MREALARGLFARQPELMRRLAALRPETDEAIDALLEPELGLTPDCVWNLCPTDSS